jgi:hypothetical protein
MGNSFADRVKNRRTDFTELEKKLNPKVDFSDDRFWYPARDDAGNGSGVIRFLPEREDAPDGQFYVEVCRHGFKDVGGAFYMNCRTTLNKVEGFSDEECPVCQANRAAIDAYGGWDSCPKAVKDSRQKYWRKTQRISNIYIVSDPRNPENEGKVFLFKYGKQVQEKIDQAVTPKFANKKQFDPFDMYTGANFEFNVTKRDGQTNNESSVFEACGPLFPESDPEADAKAEAVWRAQYDLGEFIAEKEFPPYEEQLERWNKVTAGTQPVDGSNAGAAVPEKSAKPTMAERVAARQEAGAEAPAPEPAAAPAPEPAQAATPAATTAETSESTEAKTPESVSSFFDNLGKK